MNALPYADFTLPDNGAVSMPFTPGMVRVSKDVDIPPVPPQSQAGSMSR
jgi:hypothetical protein